MPGVRHLVAAFAAFVSTCPAPASTHADASGQRVQRVDIAAPVREAARRFGLPENWIYAVIRIESAGRTRAVSAAGAMGLMQLMPGTWARQRARFALGSDPFDPRDNIMAGASYLREMYDRYGTEGFLAAYNAGPGRYEQWLAGERPLPRETRSYVARLAPLVQFDRLLPASARRPTPARSPGRATLADAGSLPLACAEARMPETLFAHTSDLAHDLFVPIWAASSQ